MTKFVDERPAPVEFDSSEHPERAVPKIFVGGPGSAVRLWEDEEWARLYGHFGCYGAAHGWHDWGFRRPPEREYCQPIVLSADLRCDCDVKWHGDRADRCQCVGDLVYRGMCLLCDWEAECFWDDENVAAEDALDHSWPGWREMPVLDRVPDKGTSAKERAKQEAWAATAGALYPEGWIEQGGPIRTGREYRGCRHVPANTPWGGYEVGVLAEGALERWEAQQAKWAAERQQRLKGA